MTKKKQNKQTPKNKTKNLTAKKTTMSKARHFLQSLEKTQITQSLSPPSTRTVAHGLPLQLDSQIPEGSRSSLANVLLLTCGHPTPGFDHLQVLGNGVCSHRLPLSRAPTSMSEVQGRPHLTKTASKAGGHLFGCRIHLPLDINNS